MADNQSEKEVKEATSSGADGKSQDAATATGTSGSKKISRMALSEVNEELKKVESQMGGFQSWYAQHLLARKKVLSKQQV